MVGGKFLRGGNVYEQTSFDTAFDSTIYFYGNLRRDDKAAPTNLFRHCKLKYARFAQPSTNAFEYRP